jgi:aspartate racemase
MIWHRVMRQVYARPPTEAIAVCQAHLADVVAAACTARGLDTIGLLGTSFAMEQPFFVGRLASHGLRVVVPDERHHDTVTAII